MNERIPNLKFVSVSVFWITVILLVVDGGWIFGDV